LLVAVILAGCGVINPGKWKGIETTGKDESYYLVKNIFLSAGSAAHPRDSFDHAVHDSVLLFFVPSNEKNHYVARTVWRDPSGQEFRTIRKTYDSKVEGDKAIARPKGGSTRVHAMPVKELWEHKPGLWKVELFIDDVLARRLPFRVR